MSVPRQATAIVVDGGTLGAPADLARVCAEQAGAKGNFPGPVPVLRRFASTLRPIQAAEAAALGAKVLLCQATRCSPCAAARARSCAPARARAGRGSGARERRCFARPSALLLGL
jgi:hypothetical protein